MPDKKAIVEALSRLPDVNGHGNLVSEGRVKNVDIDDSVIKLTLQLPSRDNEQRLRVENDCRRAIAGLPDCADYMVMIRVDMPADAAAGGERQKAPSGNPFESQAPIPGVQNIVAVASGKGGVGKSTVCVNMTLALQKRGFKVGLLDADVYGPSIHVLLDVHDPPRPGREREVAAVEKEGLKMMSLGFMMERGQPVIWRGPIVQGIVKKFLQDVEWGELDYLMIDLPPGTGDAQLTLVQTVPITSVIIVTTPSEIALVDAERGLKMFTQVNVPVMGIVENMSYFICPHCGERTDVFGTGGGRRISEQLGVDFLGEIPLHNQVRAGGDSGKPILILEPDSAISKSFLEIADRIAAKCPLKPGRE
jgi:ATP-binding protein involved in chromosome partitioning